MPKLFSKPRRTTLINKTQGSNSCLKRCNILYYLLSYQEKTKLSQSVSVDKPQPSI